MNPIEIYYKRKSKVEKVQLKIIKYIKNFNN